MTKPSFPLPLPTPGELLREEFLKPMRLTAQRLARDIGVPASWISDILAGRRSITEDIGFRLDRYLGLSEGWWLWLQVECDLRSARCSLEKWPTVGCFSRIDAPRLP